MSFLRGDLLAQMRLLVKGGVRQPPKWFDALRLVPIKPKPQRCKRAPKIVFPEDPFVESYYARHPEAKLEPFALQSFDPPPARRFAWRQMEVLPEAREQVREEIRNSHKEATGEELAKESIVWSKVEEKWARNVARLKVEAEWEAQRVEAEERYFAERRKAIREGRQPPPMPNRSILQEVQEEEAEVIKRGLEAIGAKKLKEKGRFGL